MSLTIKEYATISQDIYGINRNYPTTILRDLSTKKDQNKIYHMTDVDPYTTPGNNFYAALYIKFRDNKATEAAVAFRGTIKTIGNYLEDIFSWYSAALGTDWNDHLPTYFSKAYFFMNKVRRYLCDNFPHLDNPHHLSFTGHSLGGAIAQLMSLRYMRIYPSVCFNSVGCKEIAGPMAEDRWQSVHNVNAKYGVINKIGHVIGKLTVVDVPEYEAEAKLMFDHFNQVDFAKAVQLDRQATAVGGSFTPMGEALQTESAAYRAASLAGSTNVIADLPQVHQQFIDCEEENVLHNWYNLTALATKAALCEPASIANEYGNVIYAQHTIDNMVPVLTERQYSTIGNKLV